MGVLCKLDNIVICIKCNFSRCCVLHPGKGIEAQHTSSFRFQICKCEQKIEYASLSIARVHTAICVIEIFRVIKRNYLDSTDFQHWWEVIAWRELKTIKFNCFWPVDTSIWTHLRILRIVSQIYFLYLWFPFLHILW